MKKTPLLLFLIVAIAITFSACNSDKNIKKLVTAAQESGLLNNLNLIKELDDHGYYRKTYDDGTVLEFTPNREIDEFNIRLPEDYKNETVDRAITALLKAGEFTGDNSIFKKDFEDGKKIGGQIYGELGTGYKYRIWFPSDSNENKLYLTLYHQKKGKPLPNSNTD